jgi:hypothetical protein
MAAASQALDPTKGKFSEVKAYPPDQQSSYAFYRDTFFKEENLYFASEDFF